MSSAFTRTTRDTILRLKSESPKFRDVLRQKCQRRIQMNRWRILDDRRGIAEEEPSIQETLAQIIKEDLRSLYLSHNNFDIDKELEGLNEIKNELEDNELRWLMAECDKILDDEQRLGDILDDLNNVICPICQKSTLYLENGVANCKCGVKINTNLSMSQLKDSTMKCVELHNNSCKSDPNFTIVNEDDGNHIYLLCYLCSSFIMLI